MENAGSCMILMIVNLDCFGTSGSDQDSGSLFKVLSAGGKSEDMKNEELHIPSNSRCTDVCTLVCR